MGLAPHHTSLEVDGYRYTFAANAGIVKTVSRNEGVPPGAIYKEAIPLGGCSYNRGEVNAILKKLGETFRGNSYHLVHRNCNHFTETLATAIILNDLLVDPNQGGLESYPQWVNRLARTGSTVIGFHEDDIVPCNVMAEARKATGADEKIGWDLGSKQAKSSSAAAKSSKTKTSSKKELTQKQKEILAKIKGGSKKK